MLSLVATILVVATLYLARVVLIPIALALLLSFLLAPLVNRLEKFGLHRVPSVILVAALSFAAIGAVGYVAAVEVISLAESLPQYRQNIREKARAIAGPGMLSNASESIRSVTEEAINATTQAAETQPGAADGETSREVPDEVAKVETTRVEVVESPPNPFESLAMTIHPLIEPLGTAGIVIVFVIFMLLQREDLRDRLIALTGTSQLNLATKALDDAAQRVSRYLLMQFIVNVTYGLPVAIGLTLIGVPNAVLWGVFAAIFRYVPYVGPVIGAALPTLLALAVFDDWTRPLMVIGLFVVLELVSNNIVEPLLYGKGTGVSSMAVLTAAVFWAWLWGLPGLVLATPLTVCLVVLGRYIPQLQWLAVLLGDEPGLPLPARVYQRLLAGDHDQALDLVLEELKRTSLLHVYENVLIPAMSMAEADRHDESLDEDHATNVLAGMRALIDELDEQETKSTAPADVKGAETAAAAITRVDGDDSRPLIAIIPARDEADELAGLMLEQLLRREGQRCRTLPGDALAAETVERVVKLAPAIICVSAMPPMAVTHARYMCKRLRSSLPEARLIVGMWHATDVQRAKDRLQAGGEESVVATFTEAIDRLRM